VITPSRWAGRGVVPLAQESARPVACELDSPGRPNMPPASPAFLEKEPASAFPGIWDDSRRCSVDYLPGFNQPIDPALGAGIEPAAVAEKGRQFTSATVRFASFTPTPSTANPGGAPMMPDLLRTSDEKWSDLPTLRSRLGAGGVKRPRESSCPGGNSGAGARASRIDAGPVPPLVRVC